MCDLTKETELEVALSLFSLVIQNAFKFTLLYYRAAIVC